MRHIAAIWAAGLLLCVGAVAAAQADSRQIGQVKTVSGEAVLVRGTDRLPAKIGDPVFQNDMAETGVNGSIGVTFIDNSVFSTGPGSQVVFQDFHFQPDDAQNKMLANLRKGTLTIVSGEIPHAGPDAMKIMTPTAVLGVRGTTFAIEVH